jgi:chaperonin GroES
MASYSSPAKIKADGKRTPSLDAVLKKLSEYEVSQNIAEELDEEQLAKLGYEVERDYQTDKQSRSDWEDSAKKAMDVALQVRRPKNYPFENAANIKYPLVTVAALQFGARAYPAIIDGNRIVKCQVLGKDEGGEKRNKADRVSQHMSYQLIHQMEEWEEDTDVLLHHLPIVGCAFRKVYRSDELQRNKAEMIPAIHLVVNNKVRSLDEAPRVTHELFLYPQDIEERKLSGTFCDVELPLPAEGEASDDDAPHMFLEQHRFIDLDGDGYREPYIITVHKDSCKVVRIVANYSLNDIVDNGKRIIRIPKGQYFVKYAFFPDPKGGFYDIGFGKLLESLSETIDTTINQMLDAGNLQTAGGGFVGSGLRLKKGTIVQSPGKYTVVDTAGANIRDAIVNMEHPGPSAVLFQLLGMMIDAAQDITAVKDIMTGDSGGKVQTATTTLALIEQGLKVFTAIYKRIYRALKQEFKLLFALNAKFMDEQEYFTVLDDQKAISKTDYDTQGMDVMPVADPRMVTDMQKAAKSQLFIEIAANPLLGPLQNPREALRRIYENASIDDTDTLLVPEPEGPNPMEEVAMENAVTEVQGKKAGVMKTAAETDKIIAETEAMAGEKAERDAQEFGAKTEQELKGVLAEEAA